MRILPSFASALLIAAVHLTPQAQEARVIVKFKDGASVLRAHAAPAWASARR
jgi:hypothetical protein